jgi:hypothetical protein
MAVAPQCVVRPPAELADQYRKQLIESTLVAFAPVVEELSNLPGRGHEDLACT